jgi:hypothetical protein
LSPSFLIGLYFAPDEHVPTYPTWRVLKSPKDGVLINFLC